MAFRRDHVLGTSMNLLVRVDEASCADEVLRLQDVPMLDTNRSLNQANEVLRHADDELEQFDRECSSYRDDSPLTRLNACNDWIDVPDRLRQLLRCLDTADRLTGGAVVPWMGAVTRLWRDAALRGATPDDDTLQATLAGARATSVEVDVRNRRARRIGPATINVDAIGKALAVDRVAARLSALPGVLSVLVEIGGDIRAASRDPDARGWPVAIADPRIPFDNAAPLALLELRNAAVCTSGPTRRGDRAGWSRFSHIFSPFTGLPVAQLRSASVIAPSAVLANALATSGIVRGADELRRRCAHVPGTAALLVENDNSLRTIGQLPLTAGSFDVLHGNAGADASTRSAFKNDWLVQITLRLPKLNVKKYRRPYVAVWIEDSTGKPIRTLTVWGNEREYLREMTSWWKVAAGNKQLIAAVTRATRPPGEYKLAWDGRRDDGTAVDPGTYSICIEVNREHGGHLVRRVKLTCGDEPTDATIAACDELDETVLRYGPLE